MTPEEKVRQMEKLCPLVQDFSYKWCKHNYHSLAKAKYFPATRVVELDLSSHGMGKWSIVFTIGCKGVLRKGAVCVKAYQKFHVSHSKNSSNNGTGIYLLTHSNWEDVRCVEYSPHYFNRIRERMIEPKGIVQPSFDDLVKRVLDYQFKSSMDEISEGAYLEEDENGNIIWLGRDYTGDRKEGFKNLTRYHSDGISFGVITDCCKYRLLLTYVPNSLLYSDQTEYQIRRLSELARHKLTLRYDPFAKIKPNIEVKISNNNSLKK